MEFYTYELVDPRNNKVFYVGKGKDKRLYSHFNTIKSGRNLRNKKLGNKLKKLIRENLKPVYRKVLKTENEQEAFNKEIDLIAKYGRENLCNLTDGGEGGNHENAFGGIEGRKKGAATTNAKFYTDEKFRKNRLEKLYNAYKNSVKNKTYKCNRFAGKHHTQTTIEKMKSHKGKQLGKKNSQFGTCWITNGTKNRKISKTEKIIIKGWYYGRSI